MGDAENTVDEEEHIPSEIVKAATDAIRDILPDKSKKIYKKIYADFLSWMAKQKTNSFDEKVLLAYFSAFSKTMLPSTLWSKYSMLRTMISTEKNIDISTYPKLRGFLKKKNVGFTAKKSKIFTSKEIERYLTEAPDDAYLVTKVVLVLGIAGACRREELSKLTVDNFRDEGSVLIINIPDTKTHHPRTFTIEGKFRDIVTKYAALRPNDVPTNKFFLNYQKGKCTKQVIGINKFGAMPSQIAEYLNLSDPNFYTGHSFRRTSTTLLADSGASMTAIKRHGGWKSAQVAEGYIEDSINNKRKVSRKIAGSIMRLSSSEEDFSTEEDSSIAAPSSKRRKREPGAYVRAPTSSGETNGEKPEAAPQTLPPCRNLALHFNNCPGLKLKVVTEKD